MWPLLYLPKGEIKFENLNYRTTDLTRLIKGMMSEGFSGYMEILALHEKGLIIFYQGKVISCYYEGTDELELTQEQIIRHFLQSDTKERDTIINVYVLTPEIIESLSALEAPQPVHRELESSFMDMNKLIETLARKNFTGVLRFYRIRNNTRLGNLLLKMNKISPEQLKDAVRLQLSQGGAKRLGDALVEIGAIAHSELEDALDRQSYTRKGSDLEVAIVVFFHGRFLGGYTQDNSGLIENLQKVFSWMTGGREILMDITESQMPVAVNIERLLQVQEAIHGQSGAPVFQPLQPESTAPTGIDNIGTPAPLATAAPSLQRNISPTQSEIKKITEETFSLKADDLILESNSSEKPQPAQSVAKKPKPKPEPIAAPAPKKKSKKKPSLSELIRNEKMSIPPEAPADEYEKAVAIDMENQKISNQVKREQLPQPDEINYLTERVITVLNAQMGFLGKAIFFQEWKQSELPDRLMTPAQFRTIVKRVLKIAATIAGTKKVTEIEDSLIEDLGVLT